MVTNTEGDETGLRSVCESFPRGKLEAYHAQRHEWFEKCATPYEHSHQNYKVDKGAAEAHYKTIVCHD